MLKLRRFLSANSLTLMFVALFLVCLAGQLLTGAALYNQTQRMHGLGAVSYGGYALSGNFMQGMFSNWQAAILQLGSLIIFGVFLHQRGAPHSRRSGKSGTGEGKRGRKKASWLWANSLSLAFVLLFLAAFAAHLFSGVAAYNQTLAMQGQPQMSVAAFLWSSKFWFSTFQTWEAEYIAIALYLVLSVVLRQAGSPESKPDRAPNKATGNANK